MIKYYWGGEVDVEEDLSSNGIKVDLNWVCPQYESGGLSGDEYCCYIFQVTIKRNGSAISYDPITYYKNSQYIDFWSLKGITLYDHDVISFTGSYYSDVSGSYDEILWQDWYLSFDKARFTVNNWGIAYSSGAHTPHQTIVNSNLSLTGSYANGTGAMFADQNSIRIYSIGASYFAFKNLTGLSIDQITYIKERLDDTPDVGYIINLTHVDEYDDQITGEGFTCSPVPQQTIYVWVKFDDDYVDLPYINHNHNKDRLLKFEFNSALSGTSTTTVDPTVDPKTGDIIDPGYNKYTTTTVWQCHCFTKSSSTGNYDGIDTNMMKALKAVVDHINDSALENYTSACKIVFEGISFEVNNSDTLKQRDQIKFIL